MRKCRRAFLLPFLLLALAGCGGSDPPAPPEADPPVETVDPAPPPVTARTEPTEATLPVQPPDATPAPPQPAPPERGPSETETSAAAGCAAGEVVRVGTPRRAFAAVARGGAVAYREPGGARVAEFGPRNVNGFTTLFGVLAKRVDDRCRPAWYRVQLPLRPNGVTGWVRAADVELEPVTTRIVVELSQRRVVLYDRGEEVLRVPAAIGSSATPTPTGRYYVNQRLVPANPDGPFGPGAIGISAFSPVLTGWAQGGPIAIHGTNRPELIGQAVSNGCIRVRNDHLVRLFARALAGTPVLVRA